MYCTCGKCIFKNFLKHERHSIVQELSHVNLSYQLLQIAITRLYNMLNINYDTDNLIYNVKDDAVFFYHAQFINVIILKGLLFEIYFFCRYSYIWLVSDMKYFHVTSYDNSR